MRAHVFIALAWSKMRVCLYDACDPGIPKCPLQKLKHSLCSNKHDYYCVRAGISAPSHTNRSGGCLELHSQTCDVTRQASGGHPERRKCSGRRQGAGEHRGPAPRRVRRVCFFWEKREKITPATARLGPWR